MGLSPRSQGLPTLGTGRRDSGRVPCQSGRAREQMRVPGGSSRAALVTLLEVEVRDGVACTGLPWELGESKRLVGLGRCAEEPAREGSRLEAGGEPRVPPVEGEALGLLGAAVELHNVHWLQKRAQVRGMSGGQNLGQGHGALSPQGLASVAQ